MHANSIVTFPSQYKLSFTVCNILFYNGFILSPSGGQWLCNKQTNLSLFLTHTQTYITSTTLISFSCLYINKVLFSRILITNTLPPTHMHIHPSLSHTQSQYWLQDVLVGFQIRKPADV